MIIGIGTLLFWRLGLNLWGDAFIKRLMEDPYPENLGEMYNVFRKVGLQNVLETGLRASNGGPLKRPFGTPRHFSPWDKLLFNPVYLSRRPTVESVSINTKVVLGTQAKRPLYLEMPVIIAGMAYGTGPSLNAKIALAKGADLVNTAISTGAGPFLPEERKHTKRLIMQYNRGWWAKEEEALRQADAIEIQLGYGALGPAPVFWGYQGLTPEFRDYLHLKPGQNMIEEAMLPNAKNGRELRTLVEYLRVLTNGAPIGIKFGATQYLEDELKIFGEAGIDFLSIAGSEAGIHYGPGILADDMGLPTLPALCRAAAFLKKAGLKDKISLIISGGLYTPGEMLKALALGADAVAVGTVALLALAHNQTAKVLPWEPLTELIYENGKSKHKLKVDQAATNIANFLKSCDAEIKLAIRCLGWNSLKQVTTADLCAISKEVASITGAELGLYPPGNQTVK
ncbi:MAG: FMN-binding glutamate synthase family protein [Firmicutes bacterium]|nr:FMN-binding glutamate synthase family protein [Bacillota bacterium]